MEPIKISINEVREKFMSIILTVKNKLSYPLKWAAKKFEGFALKLKRDISTYQWWDRQKRLCQAIRTKLGSGQGLAWWLRQLQAAHHGRNSPEGSGRWSERIVRRACSLSSCFYWFALADPLAMSLLYYLCRRNLSQCWHAGRSYRGTLDSYQCWARRGCCRGSAELYRQTFCVHSSLGFFVGFFLGSFSGYHHLDFWQLINQVGSVRRHSLDHMHPPWLIL